MFQAAGAYLDSLLFLAFGLFLYVRAPLLVREADSPEDRQARHRWLRRAGLGLMVLAAIKLVAQLTLG